ncbi:hypothetical protein [Azospirillum doebereinerae]|uniref:Uncharacterized protein n=1 Tax=Azospirillum doebereinerae TaxID=92933 RepID=A0A3S0X7L0_9PROT|nr:hypothetical protein [Azospirillum doebereinerae]RUQ64001.1 hypothetical protein EJ913_27140 [Azospirillum doebereinerae]
MTRHLFEAVLRLQLGPVDRDFEARITYQGGPFQADIETIEVQTEQGWIPVPWLIDLVEDCPALFDALRAHACGRVADARCVARRL